MSRNKNRLRVLHLISGGDTGGAKTHIISLLKELNKLIDTRLICFIKDIFYQDALEAGIDIKVFEQKSRMDFSIIKRLIDEIEDEGYHIIHCHGARANLIGMLVKGKVSVPIITTIHSDYKLDFDDNFYKKIIYTNLNILALKRMDYYIAISDSFKSILIERSFASHRIFTVYNGIDMEAPMAYVEKEEFLNSYGIPGHERVIIGIMGRLDLVKDHETFIKAAADILKDRKDILFLIAGTGNDEARLKKLVDDMGLQTYIYFLGFVKDQYSFFNAIDINVLTSLSESFPYVLMEGARLKKPAITTRVGGIDKLIKDNHSGYLIEVGDWQALADRINVFLQDKDLLKSMGENLYERLRLRFSSQIMAEEHCQIYRKLLKHGGEENEDIGQER